jgi:hypothetical protein
MHVVWCGARFRAMTTGFGRLWRRLFPGSNPLRRRSDRVEGGALAVAVLLVALAVPVGVQAGVRVAGAEARQADHLRTTGRPSVAVLLADTPRSTGQEGVGERVPVRARWTTAHGSRVGLIDANAGMTRGSKMRIWVDRQGDPVDAPAHRGQIVIAGIGAGLGLLLGVTLSVWLGWRLVRGVLDRGRLAAWDREWRRIGPRWTHRLR